MILTKRAHQSAKFQTFDCLGEISSICTLKGFFCWEYIKFQLNKYREVMKNLANFHQSIWKSPNWDFDDILLSTVGNAWVWNLQGSYASWQWAKLKSNWLVSSKLTWGIWQILTWALRNLKNCTLMGCFWPKYRMFELKIYREVIFNSTEYWSKIWRKTAFAFKNDLKNLANFHQNRFESLKIGTLMGSFYPK